MNVAKLCQSSINALIAYGFVDTTYYRYIFFGYNSRGDIIASRISLWIVLFGGTPEVETVRIIPR